jgi:hypothetical protein
MTEDEYIEHAQRQMIIGRNEYIREVRAAALNNQVKVTMWEIEEIEMAFERAFTLGFSFGSHKPGEVTGQLN